MRTTSSEIEVNLISNFEIFLQDTISKIQFCPNPQENYECLAKIIESEANSLLEMLVNIASIEVKARCKFIPIKIEMKENLRVLKMNANIVTNQQTSLKRLDNFTLNLSRILGGFTRVICHFIIDFGNIQ
jgi:hypothetical protein